MRGRQWDLAKRTKLLLRSLDTACMDVPLSHEVTRLLKAWSGGDHAALQELIPLVYDELHHVAHYHMSAERHDHTLQTTALIHEVYLRLLNVRDVDWQNRTHFLALCARLMRNTLIDLARARLYKKRGGNVQHVVYDETGWVRAPTFSPSTMH